MTVRLLDRTGATVSRILTQSQTPASGVVIQDTMYHTNLSTTGIAPGQYALEVRFNSPSLLGTFSLSVTLT